MFVPSSLEERLVDAKPPHRAQRCQKGKKIKIKKSGPRELQLSWLLLPLHSTNQDSTSKEVVRLFNTGGGLYYGLLLLWYGQSASCKEIEELYSPSCIGPVPHFWRN